MAARLTELRDVNRHSRHVLGGSLQDLCAVGFINGRWKDATPFEKILFPTLQEQRPLAQHSNAGVQRVLENQRRLCEIVLAPSRQIIGDALVEPDSPDSIDTGIFDAVRGWDLSTWPVPHRQYLVARLGYEGRRMNQATPGVIRKILESHAPGFDTNDPEGYIAAHPAHPTTQRDAFGHLMARIFDRVANEATQDYFAGGHFAEACRRMPDFWRTPDRIFEQRQSLCRASVAFQTLYLNLPLGWGILSLLRRDNHPRHQLTGARRLEALRRGENLVWDCERFAFGQLHGPGSNPTLASQASSLLFRLQAALENPAEIGHRQP